jgi:hypothetical protein
MEGEMNTAAAKVESILERRLRDASLSKFVSREKSQFLDLQDELFVEVVLIDGAALDDVNQIVKETAEELRTQGITLDSVVRALWEIVNVNYVGPSRGPSGGLRAALEFRAVLRSGSRDCQVIVDVYSGATEFLERKLGLKEFVSREHGALRQGHLDEEMVARMVRGFLQHQLSAGGTSYWNPLRYERLELNDAAMSLLLGQGTAFEELLDAISGAFEHSVLESFVKVLSLSGIRIDRVEAVLPELSSMLGGAYSRGGTLSTIARELFEKLERPDQELLKKYFDGKVDRLKADSRFPELVHKFPKVFL